MKLAIPIRKPTEPNSARAQQQYAALLYNRQDVASAISVTQNALDLRPEDTTLNLWNAILLCQAGTLRAAKFDDIADVLEAALERTGGNKTRAAQALGRPEPKIGHRPLGAICAGPTLILSCC